MSEVLSRDFEGTSGAQVTAANANAANLSGSSAIYDNTAPVQGSTMMRVATSSTLFTLRFDLASPVTLGWFSFYWRTPSAAPAANVSLCEVRTATTTKFADLRYGTDGRLTLRNSNSVAVATTTSALPADTDVRIAIKAEPGNSTGGLRLRVYVGANRHGTTPDYDSGNQAVTGGFTNVNAVALGHLTSSTMTSWFDRLRVDDAAEPAPPVVNTPPAVDAGPDLTKTAGSANFSITATATPQSGATITSRSWVVQSGATVTLTNATTDTVTVTPPATTGTTTLRYTATDSNGLTGSDDVTITWTNPPAGTSLYVRVSGTWVTARLFRRVSGAWVEVVL